MNYQWVDYDKQWVDNNNSQWVPSAAKVDLSAYIDVHTPSDLKSLIDVHLPKYLSGNIRGLTPRNLPASLRSMQPRDLSAILSTIPPKDLFAYLKVWPQEDLFGYVHGWDKLDLSGYINSMLSKDLLSYVGMHSPKNLGALIKGWVREATHNLGSNISSYTLNDLPVTIRPTEFFDLVGYLFSVQPRNLSGLIHGWQEFDLSAVLIGDDWPWDISASITSTGGFIDLLANVHPVTASGLYRDMSAYILSTKGVQNLSAAVNIFQASDLAAFIDTGRGVANLAGSILPKMIKLTGVISIVTMEHKDLSATISIPCFYSSFKDIGASIKTVYLKDLSANIQGVRWAEGVSDLGAKWGFASGYIVQDKLPINITIKPLDYRVEDKLKLYLQLYRDLVNLSSSIIGEYVAVDLSAYVYPIMLSPYDFERHKNKERVFSRTYAQVVTDFEDIDIEFEDIVRDYLYSGVGNVVAKTDRYQHFLTKVSSYYSPATSRRLDKTLHKTRILYDLRKFNSIDEAMKYAIDYLTSYPYASLGAYIKSVGKYTNLSAMISVLVTHSTSENLNSYINGTILHPYDVVLAIEDDGINYL